MRTLRLLFTPEQSPRPLLASILIHCFNTLLQILLLNILTPHRRNPQLNSYSLIQVRNKIGENATHFELVLWFCGVWNVAFQSESSEVLTLRTGFCARIHPTELQEVAVLDNIITRQIGDDSAFIHIFAALSNGAFYLCSSQLHLQTWKTMVWRS